MTPFELADCLRELSQELDRLAAQALELKPEPNERRLSSQDILGGSGQLATVGFAPGYRDACLIVNLQTGQRLEVSLSVQDSLFLHEELSRMIEVAGSRPLGEGSRP